MVNYPTTVEMMELITSQFRNDVSTRKVIIIIMIYIVVLFLCCLKIALVDRTSALGLEENDICKLRSNIPGYCVNINNCDYAYALLVFGYKPELCGFNGSTAIVCCTNFTYEAEIETLKPALVTTKKPLLQNGTRILPVISKSNKSDDYLSTKKCKDYYPKINAILISTGSGGGVKAQVKEFRHMALLGYGNQNDTHYLCGGSLISFNFVLTAAHCTFSTEFGNPFIVRLGELDISAEIDKQDIQDIPIKKIFIHPGYKQPQRYHDIGLLELETNARKSKFVNPACLYTSGIQLERSLIATGWGRTSFTGDVSSYLLKVELDVVPIEKCQNVYRDVDDDIQLCAGDGKIKDTCQGDSGGPLQQLNPNQPEWRRVYDIVAVTSYGTACGLTKNPGVYTRVYPHLQWIENIVWATESIKTY